MFSVHARYRGREFRRADIVSRSAAALATLDGVSEFERLGIEDIRAKVDTAEAVSDLVMALLSDGSWSVGIGIDLPSRCEGLATEAVTQRAGEVRVRLGVENPVAGDLDAVFLLLGHVLSKRTLEGREATSLVRRGLSQIEAARRLEISKQAMSQRLQAAGWAAEKAGWGLAVSLLNFADGL